MRRSSLDCRRQLPAARSHQGGRTAFAAGSITADESEGCGSTAVSPPSWWENELAAGLSASPTAFAAELRDPGFSCGGLKGSSTSSAKARMSIPRRGRRRATPPGSPAGSRFADLTRSAVFLLSCRQLVNGRAMPRLTIPAPAQFLQRTTPSRQCRSAGSRLPQ